MFKISEFGNFALQVVKLVASGFGILVTLLIAIRLLTLIG